MILQSRKEAIISGASKYFNGIPCPNGHIASRYVLGGCTKCNIESAKNRRAENSALIAENQRRWRSDNAATLRKKKKEWYRKNSERIKATRRKRYADNPDYIKDINQKSRNKHIEAARERQRNQNRKRRAANYGLYEHATRKQIAELRRAAKGRCAYCREKCKLTVDHIVPLLRGGSDLINNMQMICLRCNISKNARDPIDYAQSIGLLL